MAVLLLADQVAKERQYIPFVVTLSVVVILAVEARAMAAAAAVAVAEHWAIKIITALLPELLTQLLLEQAGLELTVAERPVPSGLSGRAPRDNSHLLQ